MTTNAFIAAIHRTCTPECLLNRTQPKMPLFTVPSPAAGRSRTTRRRRIHSHTRSRSRVISRSRSARTLATLTTRFPVAPRRRRRTRRSVRPALLQPPFEVGHVRRGLQLVLHRLLRARPDTRSYQV